MDIREYKSTNCAEMAELFYNTVHEINAKDYTKQQVDAWATGNIDRIAWDKSFLEHNTFVAEENDILVGFGDINDSGYVDRLYVHKDYQGKGIATAILTELERHAAKNNSSTFTVHASITAKPFFENQGYSVVRENKVTRNDVELTNFMMEKQYAKCE